MNFRVDFLELKAVPVAALVRDQAVAALQEPAVTKAIRIGPLKDESRSVSSTAGVCRLRRRLDWSGFA